jgi:hypothetical protein
MWNWIKKIFSPQKQVRVKQSAEKNLDLSKMTKGDLKKLHAQGKITADKLKP